MALGTWELHHGRDWLTAEAASCNSTGESGGPDPRAGRSTTHALIPEPRTALESAGVRAGEITGWRVWVWLGHSQMMRSAIMSYLWEPKIKHIARPISHDMANDVYIGIDELDKSCSRGFHAFKTPEDAMHYANEWLIAFHEMLIVGSISMWGEMIEYERGWCSQYCAVRSLDHWLKSPIEWAYAWNYPQNWREMITRHDVPKNIKEMYGV